MTLELSEALIYVTHKMQISSGSLAQFSLCLFGFQCPLLSNPVTCPFHQTYPHSVIKGRLGIISFLNLAFRRISCSCSMFIFMAINSHARSNQKQTGRPVLPLVALLQTVYSPHHPLTAPPCPSNPCTTPHIKHMQMQRQTSCPRAPLVPDYLQFMQGKTHNVTHLHKDALLSSDVQPLFKKRKKEKPSYPHLLCLYHEVYNESSETLGYLRNMFGV